MNEHDHASVVRVSRHTPKTGRHDEVAGLLRTVAESMRDAHGCFGARLMASNLDPQKLILVSRWESAEAEQRFKHQPDFTALQRELQDVLAGPPEVEVFTAA